MTSPRVRSGNRYLFFAFDGGFDVDLVRAAPLAEGAFSPGISGSRPSPQYLQYRPPPLVVPLGTVALPVPGGGTAPFQAACKVFDFGVLSVSFRCAVEDEEWSRYVETALFLSASPVPEAEALRLAGHVLSRISAAVTRPRLSDLVEDYRVWHVGSFFPWEDAGEALAAVRGDAGRLLALEPGTLSAEALADLTGRPVRYHGNDLFLADWNASFVVDPKHGDTVEVLEFMNVQLLELRFFDRLLESALDEAEGEARKERRLPALFHDRFGKALRRVSGLKVDVALLRERSRNALKIAGDSYLARLHEEAFRKAGGDGWEEAVRDRLSTLSDIYAVLEARAAAARAEALEAIIIVLIAVEIVLGLLKGH